MFAQYCFLVPRVSEPFQVYVQAVKPSTGIIGNHQKTRLDVVPMQLHSFWGFLLKLWLPVDAGSGTGTRASAKLPSSPNTTAKELCGNRKKKCSAVDLRVIMTMHPATQTVKCQDAKIYQISGNKRLPYIV